MRSVFVSSTFKDMHYERDAIKLIAEPLLNQEARKYGEEFYFCDLRWGINTGDLDTDEGAKKVLDVCLEEIDRCEPPMVVLLGDRYGWIPEADLIKTAADSKHFALDDLEKSVTALEIEYGALRDGEKIRNTLFYFRNIEGCPPPVYIPEDAEEEAKIRELKDSIRKMVRDITGESIREYTLTWNGRGFDGVDDFANMLAGDIRDMLLPRWEKLDDRTSFERERIIHDTFIREKSILFKARQARADKLITLALSEPVTVIKGEIGSGKSTLFSHMVTELEKTGWDVLPFISGLTPESNSEDDIIQNIVYFMEEELEVTGHYIDEKNFTTGEPKRHTLQEWEYKLNSLYSAYQKTGKRLFIMVDAADQLTPIEEMQGLTQIVSGLTDGHSHEPDNVHFVITCTPDYGIFNKEWHIHELEPINQEDKLSVIDGILIKNGRELSKSVIDEMMHKKCSDNPLYLSLIVQRLLMMNSDDFASIMSRGDGMAAIERHQQTIIKDQCPDDLDEMNAVLLHEAGKRINGKFVSRIVECIAVSRSGLNRKALSKILGEEWAEYDFALFDHFVNYMNDCFLMRDDGCYDFSHKSIREGFLKRCKDIKGIHREILEGLKALEADDTIRKREIIYHTIEADEKRFLIDYIKEWKERESDQKDTSYIRYAFEEIHAQCIADNGQWIIDALNDAKTYEADEELKYLFYLCNGIGFSGRQKEQEIKLAIWSAAADLFEHVYRELKMDVFRRALYYSYDNVVCIYTEQGGREGLEQAWKLYLKMKETAPDILDGINYADKWVKLAWIYGDSDELENLKRKEELYDECLRIWSREASKIGYTQVKFVNSYLEASQIYKKLGKIYEDRGMRCQVIGDQRRIVNLERALELYLKDLEITKRFAVEQRDPHRDKNLSIGYIKAARVYRQLGGMEHAEKMYAKGLKIKEEMEDEVARGGEEGKVHDYQYVKIGEIYEALGVIPNLFTWPVELSDLEDIENLQEALEWYRRGLEISLEKIKEYHISILESNGTADFEAYYKYPLYIYDKISAVCEEMAKWYSYLEVDGVKLKSELHRTVLEINEKLRKDLGSIEDPKLKLRLKDLENKAKELDHIEKDEPEMIHPWVVAEKMLATGTIDASRAFEHDNKTIFPGSYAIAAIIGHGSEYWERFGFSGIFDMDVTNELKSHSKSVNKYETYDGYVTLAESLFHAAMYTAVTTSDRKKLLVCALDIARELYDGAKRYQQKDPDRYWNLITKYAKPLAEQIACEQYGKEPDGTEDPKLQGRILDIRKRLEAVEGDAYFGNGYTQAYNISYRKFDLPEALGKYYKEDLYFESAVALNRRYDMTSDGFEAYETLAGILLEAALKSTIAVSDKKKLLDMGLEIAKDLYEKAKTNKTISDPGRYKTLVDKFSEALYDK